MLFDLDNVHKHYGDFHALKGVTLRVPEGSVGLLGPNGAGKSTLIKMLLGLLDISSGSATVLGCRLPDEAVKVRQMVGYMPENDCYLPYMTAVQYVSFGGELAGMPRAEAFRRAHEVLYYVGLGEARYRQLSGFSTGMKQRVKLAQAIVQGPRLVFLDEPTNGLDPTGRDEMLELIEDVKSRGINVLLSSHLLPDVERVCDSVIMLNQGGIIFQGAMTELKSGGESMIEIETKDQNTAFEKVLKEKGFKTAQEGLRLRVYIPDDADRNAILQLAVNHDIQIRHFVPGELTLESAFLGLLEANA